MPERIMPGLGLRSFYDPGQRDWGTTLSEDLRRLSALVHLRVLSRSTALPATGTAGDIYIVPAGAAAHAGDIALWDGQAGAEAWVYIAPAAGWEAWVGDEAARVRFDGAEWGALAAPGVAPINAYPGDHVLAPGDMGAIVEVTAAVAAAVTIPDDVSVAFPVGTLVNVTQVGAGPVTIAAAAGVTLNAVAAGSCTLDAQWAGAALTKRGADAWVVQGAISEVA